MIKIFYQFLICFFILSIISCGQTSEETFNQAVSNTNDAVNNTAGAVDDALFGENDGIMLGDEAPENVIFSETILDPDTTLSGEFEESASDIIRTSSGDYVVVGTSISWEWPMPDNMDDILIVKIDGTSGKVIWNKKIHHRNFDRGTSIVQGNDGNYVITGFTSSDDANKSDVFFGKVDPQGNVLTKKAIRITNK